MDLQRVLLLVLATFFLLSLACGQVVVPVEQAGSGPGQSGSAGVPENEIEGPLATLAPLPDSSDEETAAAGVAVEIDPSDSESIVVNDIAWTLLDAVYLGETLESGTEEIPDLVANGRLLGLRFSISNQGDDLHTFFGLAIVDSDGQSYSYLSDSLDFIIEEESCELVELEPEGTITCTAIYDVPTEASDLRAVFNDLSLVGGEEKLVGLGLVQ